jgi:hypothetical protein
MTNVLVISTRRLVMKKTAQRAPLSRSDKLAIGLSASSATLVTAICAAREMGGPILAAGVAVGLATLAAILLFVFRDRSPAPTTDASAERDGAVEALAAL